MLLPVQPLRWKIWFCLCEKQIICWICKFINHNTIIQNTEYSSVQDGIYALGKGHNYYLLHPIGPSEVSPTLLLNTENKILRFCCIDKWVKTYSVIGICSLGDRVLTLNDKIPDFFQAAKRFPSQLSAHHLPVHTIVLVQAQTVSNNTNCLTSVFSTSINIKIFY